MPHVPVHVYSGVLNTKPVLLPARADQHAEAPVHLERGQVVRHLAQADHHALLHVGAQLEAVLVTETNFSIKLPITLEHFQLSICFGF